MVKEDPFKHLAETRGQGDGAKFISARFGYGHYSAGGSDSGHRSPLKAQIKKLK